MKLPKDIEIVFDDGFGEFGVHDGFFNAIAIIDGKEFHFQCCCDDNSIPEWDSEDAGITWGICGDANSELYEYLDYDWENVTNIIKHAFKIYFEKPFTYFDGSTF